MTGTQCTSRTTWWQMSASTLRVESRWRLLLAPQVLSTSQPCYAIVVLSCVSFM
jgi:hypothetical protein